MAEDGATLLRSLSPPLQSLQAVSAELTVQPPPPLAPVLSVQTARLLESLALCSDQAARLVDETAQVVGRTARVLGRQGPAYGQRAWSLLSLLRRAEAWLETLDQETGAHITLPGFGPGAPSLETQVGLQ